MAESSTAIAVLKVYRNSHFYRIWSPGSVRQRRLLERSMKARPNHSYVFSHRDVSKHGVGGYSLAYRDEELKRPGTEPHATRRASAGLQNDVSKTTVHL